MYTYSSRTTYNKQRDMHYGIEQTHTESLSLSNSRLAGTFCVHVHTCICVHMYNCAYIQNRNKNTFSLQNRKQKGLDCFPFVNNNNHYFQEGEKSLSKK